MESPTKPDSIPRLSYRPIGIQEQDNNLKDFLLKITKSDF